MSREKTTNEPIQEGAIEPDHALTTRELRQTIRIIPFRRHQLGVDNNLPASRNAHVTLQEVDDGYKVQAYAFYDDWDEPRYSLARYRDSIVNHKHHECLMTTRGKPKRFKTMQAVFNEFAEVIGKHGSVKVSMDYNNVDWDSLTNKDEDGAPNG